MELMRKIKLMVKVKHREEDGEKRKITPPIDARRDQAVLKKNKFTATRISQMSKKIIIGA